MKKKYLIFGVGVVLCLSLVACGGQKATQAPQEPDQKVVQQMETAPDLVQVKAETPVEPEDTAEENKVDEAAPVEEAGPVEEVETVELFTSCEETVYAIDNVNIRASWTSSSDKLGSLARGDSVTRTGNSITGTEAENWSRVQLSDGSTAYINNNYLSLTKPAVTQATTGGTGGTGGGTATGGSGGGSESSSKTTQQQATQQTPAQPASGDTLTEADKKAMEQAIAPGQAPGGSVNSIPGVTFSPEGLTEEQRQRQAEKSGAILRGEAQLQIDENGVYYYEF